MVVRNSELRRKIENKDTTAIQLAFIALALSVNKVNDEGTRGRLHKFVQELEQYILEEAE